MYTDTYIIRIPKDAHVYGYVFIQNQTDPDLDGTATEQTSIHRVIFTERCFFYIDTIIYISNKNLHFPMISDSLIDCRKCSLFKNYH